MSARRGGHTRRQVLHGAGVALGLPFLSSLAPRAARGESMPARRRFVAISFPGGAAPLWKPRTSGRGGDWQLSPILQPLQPLKSLVTVLSNVGNYGPFGGHTEPAAQMLTAAFLSCAKTKVASLGASDVLGGVSVDQVIAAAVAGGGRVPSLQLGLATLLSPSVELPVVCARAISWASRTRPLLRNTSPRAVFDQLVTNGPLAVPGSDAAAMARRAANRSVLDLVRAHAASVQGRLGTGDRQRLDEYLTSVREVETRVTASSLPDKACAALARPDDVFGNGQDGVTPPGYNRDQHADVMIDLMVLALRCDATRVVSLMMDDARSFFRYDLPARAFTSEGSTATTGRVRDNLPALQQGGTPTYQSQWASVTYWMVSKLARLGQALAAADDGFGGSVLDTTTIWFGSEMHGANNDGLDLPVLILGTGGGRLAGDQHIDFGTGGQELSNVYLTFLQKVFDLPVQQFGQNLRESMIARGTLSALLA